MSRIIRSGIALAVTLIAAGAHGLGLGPVEVRSGLNQPLQAAIPLLDVSGVPLSAIVPNLSSPEQFAVAGLARPELLSTLRFAVVPGAPGEARIYITSTRPVRDSYLSFLLEVNWPKGRLLREYILLIDPVTDGALPPVAASAERVVAAAKHQRPEIADQRASGAAPDVAADVASTVDKAPVRPVPAGPVAPVRLDDSALFTEVESIVRVGPSPRAAVPAGAGAGTSPDDARALSERFPDYRAGMRVEIAPKETLWDIAVRYRPDSAVSSRQMMLALVDRNPQAFVGGNINRLRKGSLLVLPSLSQIFARTPEAASLEVRRHIADWRAEEGLPEAGASLAPAPDGAARVVIAPKQTIWEIAERYRPDNAIPVRQMIDALVAKNPHAFVADDAGRMKKGEVLMIPTRLEVEHLTGSR